MRKSTLLVLVAVVLGMSLGAQATLWSNDCDSLTGWRGNSTMNLSIQNGGPSGTFLQMASYSTGNTTSISPDVTVSTGDKLTFDATAIAPTSFPDFSVQVHYVNGDKWEMIRDWAWIATPWTHYEYTLPQDGAINVINFNIYASGKTLGLDNVVITPEPMSLSLLACAGLALISRRRRQ